MHSFFLFGLLLPFFSKALVSSWFHDFLVNGNDYLFTVIGLAIFQKQVTVLKQQLIPPLVSQLITVCLIWPRLLSSSFAPSTLNPVNCILISIRLCLDFYIILSYKTKIHWYKPREILLRQSPKTFEFKPTLCTTALYRPKGKIKNRKSSACLSNHSACSEVFFKGVILSLLSNVTPDYFIFQV